VIINLNNKKYFYGDRQKIESVKSMDFLKGVSPKFAEHMYQRNRVVEAFAMSELGGVDVLSQPVCGKCEKPGMNTINPDFKSTGDEDKDREIYNCYCEACGTTTYNTLTVRQYLLRELKVKEDKVEKFESNLYGGSFL
jgi:hypothetical protein